MRFRKTGITLATLACCAILAGPLVAVEWQPIKRPGQLRSPIRDVALDASGSLRGELRNGEGRLWPHADIQLRQNEVDVRQTRTDRTGRFAFRGLRGGVYRILTPADSVTCRAWTIDAAPPDAPQIILVTSNAGLVRGQQPMNEKFTFNPFLMGTLIAAAIAIPIAIHNSDDRPPGS